MSAEFQNGGQQTPVIERATSGDFEEIHQLLQQNFIGNLADSDRKDGFLSVEFSLADIEEMSDNGITVIARMDKRLVGFLSTQTCRFNQSIPIAKKMIDALAAQPGGAPVDLTQSLVCGPVCIEKSARGQGLLEGMYQCLAHEANDEFRFGITFVASENTRSIRAHREKLNMRPGGSFEHAGKQFEIFVTSLAQYL